ncbi:hypothetical protein DY000_02033581 [Brassica cretica]|uniref:Uncharacterized protein n=1 Tax=Brassica cretica TaxID=69181 RepID=A0ABQ7DEX6_BRACR|nr:hypothetical protein DY000_02033581 [Brassica cretica]
MHAIGKLKKKPTHRISTYACKPFSSLSCYDISSTSLSASPSPPGPPPPTRTQPSSPPAPMPLHAVSSLISFNSADNSCWSPPYDSNPPPYQTHALPHSPQFLIFPRKTALLPRTMLTRSVEV